LVGPPPARSRIESDGQGDTGSPTRRCPGFAVVLGEDADTGGTDEQADDDEDDAGQDGPSDEGDDPPYDEDHGYEPKDPFHGRLMPAAQNRNIRPVSPGPFTDPQRLAGATWPVPSGQRCLAQAGETLTIGHKTKNGPGGKRRVLLIALPRRANSPTEVGEFVSYYLRGKSHRGRGGCRQVGWQELVDA
jgi:hypothetical protein